MAHFEPKPSKPVSGLEPFFEGGSKMGSKMTLFLTHFLSPFLEALKIGVHFKWGFPMVLDQNGSKPVRGAQKRGPKMPKKGSLFELFDTTFGPFLTPFFDPLFSGFARRPKWGHFRLDSV